jgi:hypothetical protein
MAERSYHAHIHLTRSEAREALEELKTMTLSDSDWHGYLLDKGISVSALPRPTTFAAPNADAIDELIAQAEILSPSDQEGAAPWGFLVAFAVMSLGS